MKVVLEKSGIVVFLSATPDYIREMQEWSESRCSTHPNREYRRFPTANGGVQIRQQCLDCGHVIGGSRKKTPHDVNLPLIDREIEKRYDEKHQQEFVTIQQKHALLQHRKETAFFQEHDRYLQSEVWKAKRRLVLRRASGRCEGCGLKDATQVHHLTYKHHMEEFLFELVAVCEECHNRLHADEVEPENEVEEQDI